ncbi:phage major capsid protein [Testudinibacter sp. TR-2022]|uniref:phage major capsid protein n=1 Tax=Testudinibacter sp. TR-2022 TaxID=2585029 RepID=UPI00111A8F11|nr:phage major capsid protein [Testudinibacter sp. TR-2022]TNH06317.1 phage major capsid protein [Pasteurellaceae bacterium Phil11]TNH22884.1 phage major capsid protein [Testudinibacter sp. TR-2022]TNH23885.1 phage major capsid protein [Testudinibacter sp. TR-2022]
MFKKLLELRQQKAKLAEDMRNLLTQAETENRNLSEAEAKTFDELRSQAATLKTDIERYESLADEERSQGGQPVETKTVQFSNDELRHYIKTGELRSLSTTANDDGGYTVIPQLDKQVMTRLTDDSVMRQICHVVRLPVGAKEFKKLVSAGGATVQHGTEGTARTETNTAKLNEVTIALNAIYAYPKTTQEILDFSSIDILDWLSEEISETFTETEESDLTSGDGTKKAKGLLTYARTATADKTRAFGTLQKLEVANAAGITADSLIDLFYTLHSKYRKNAVWVMSSAIAAQLQKLKNGNGDYIWRDGLTAGAPATLLGLPVHYLETMPTGGAGKAVIALGDFNRGYYIIDHATGVRTRPDNITEPGFYKVHTDKYLGGGVVDSNAIKFIETKA